MFGTVKMPDGTTATLEDDGYWTHPIEAIQCMLNLEHSLHGRKSISHAHAPGNIAIQAVAKAYSGEAFPENVRETAEEEVVIS